MNKKLLQSKLEEIQERIRNVVQLACQLDNQTDITVDESSNECYSIINDELEILMHKQTKLVKKITKCKRKHIVKKQTIQEKLENNRIKTQNLTLLFIKLDNQIDEHGENEAIEQYKRSLEIEQSDLMEEQIRLMSEFCRQDKIVHTKKPRNRNRRNRN